MGALLLTLGLVHGCALPGGGAPAPIEDRQVTPRAAHPAAPGATPAPAVAAALAAQFRQWQGTPYAAGGRGRSGVDCSAYVAAAFRDGLGIDLPRTTAAQAARGRPVARGALAAGDLVFFRTGRTARHVGIYLGSGRFTHASRRRGVVVSQLDERYWRSRFWQARRIVDDRAR